MDLTLIEKVLLKGCVDHSIAEFSQQLATSQKESERVVKRKVIKDLLELTDKVESIVPKK